MSENDSPNVPSLTRVFEDDPECTCATCGRSFDTFRRLRIHQGMRDHQGTVAQTDGKIIQDLVGTRYENVPKIPPDNFCNARLSRREDGRRVFDGFCREPTSGTRCKAHGRDTTGPRTEEGKAITKYNGITHGRAVDPTQYMADIQDPDEQRFFELVNEELESAIERNTGELDFINRVLAMNAASMMCIALRSQDYAFSEGLFETIFTSDGAVEVKNRVLDDLRLYNKDLIRLLRDIGALESQDSNVDLTVEWTQYISNS